MITLNRKPTRASGTGLLREPGPPPHILIRTFELLVLFPLGLCVLVGGVALLFGRTWITGGFFLLMSGSLALVRHGLPHRRFQKGREMARGERGYRVGKLTPEDGRGFAYAVFRTSVIFGLVIAAVALHRRLSWPRVLGYAFASWFSCLFGSVVICLAVSLVAERRSRSKPNVGGVA